MNKMNGMSLKQILRVTGGALIKKGSKQCPVTDISTDSRDIGPGALFIALTGMNFDGHDYIVQAVMKGACAVCVSDPGKLPEGDYTAISVEDTLKAYQAIASSVREDRGYIVVGVTGSVGKTSTREMISSAISPGIKTYQTRENFNNEIGVPKTLIETPEDAQVCITEMGMRKKGEIHELAIIARPDIAVVTNIGISHIELLGSKDEIFSTKMEILDGLNEDGLLILNINDSYLSEFCSQAPSKYRIGAVYTGDEIPVHAEFTVRGYDLRQTSVSVSFNAEIKSYQGIPIILKDVMIHIPGAHNVMNALISIAVAVELDLKLRDVIRGISKYTSIGNRQKIFNQGTLTIIDDTYNASPESMQSAISMLSDVAGTRRRIAILGGMLELGDYSGLAHEEVGRACYDGHIDMVFSFGNDAESIKKGIEIAQREAADENTGVYPTKYFIFDTRDELTDELLKQLKNDDVLLIKGSRGYEMEKVTQSLTDADLTKLPLYGGNE